MKNTLNKVPENSIKLPLLPHIDRVTAKNDSLIEINMENLTLDEQMTVVKSLYTAYRNEFTKQKRLRHERNLESSPDAFVKKTYQIKESIVHKFATQVQSEDKEIGKCLTKIMIDSIKKVHDGYILPAPATYEKHARYLKKTYRVQNAVAQQFKQLCKEKKVPVGPMLQTLIEEYLEKGECSQ